MTSELPVRTFEASAMLAAFPAASSRLRALTPDALRLVELWPGRAPLVVVALDHARTSIGPYGEVAIAWPVVDSRSQPPPVVPLLLEQRWPGFGLWVHRRAVTTEIANDVGRSAFGFPSLVAAVEYSWEGSTRVCRLADDDAEILTLAVETRLAAFPRQFHLRAYSVLAGELLATRLDVDAVGLRKLTRTHARLSLGRHPLGRELADAGVDAAHSIEIRWFPVWRATLPAPETRRRIARPHAGEPDHATL